MNKYINKKNILNIVIVVFLFVINLLFLLKHEMWRDESQPWCIAVNLSFGDMISQFRVEGCPALWFFVLRFMAMLGLRFSMLGYVTLFIIIVSSFIFIFKSDLPIYTRIIWIFSSIFNYYNAVIARNYALVVLFVVLIIVLYRYRDEYKYLYAIVVSLLIQTNVFVLGMSSALILEIIYRGYNAKDKRTVYSSIIPIMSCLLCVLELMRTKGEKLYINWTPDLIINNYLKFGKNFRLVVNSTNIVIGYGYSFVLFIGFVILLVIIFTIYNIIREKKYINLLLLFLPNACTYILFILVKEGGGPINNIVCCILILLLSLAIQYFSINNKLNKQVLLIVLTVLPLLTIQKTMRDGYNDIQYSYSESKNIALYVKNNVPSSSIIVYDVSPQISPVLAYIQEYRSDIKNIDLINQEELLCHVWNKEYQNKEKELQINDYIKRLYKDYDNIYYISTNERLKLNNLVLIKDFMTESNAIVYDEKYKLYLIDN